MTTRSKLRCAVIGLGIGRDHIKGYQAHPGAEVVAICDLDEIRLQTTGEMFNIPRRFTSATEMFEQMEIDLVSVATPNKFHLPLTLEAFAAGTHVLCEKPMANNATEGRQMVEASRKAGRRLMINHSYRFHPSSWALKLLATPENLGHIYAGRTRWLRRDGFPDFGGWFGQKALSGGGPLIDLGVHRLDLALWIMGYPEPKHVLGNVFSYLGQARAKELNQPFDVEDYASALITFTDGRTLQLEASWAAHIHCRSEIETTLLGTLGGITQRNKDGKLEYDSILCRTVNGCQLDSHIAASPAPPSSMFHFVDAILNDQPHLSTAEEGLKVMEILDAIYASAAAGGAPVSL